MGNWFFNVVVEQQYKEDVNFFFVPGNDFLLYYTELLLLFCFLGVSVHVIGLY